MTDPLVLSLPLSQERSEWSHWRWRFPAPCRLSSRRCWRTRRGWKATEQWEGRVEGEAWRSRRKAVTRVRRPNRFPRPAWAPRPSRRPPLPPPPLGSPAPPIATPPHCESTLDITQHYRPLHTGCIFLFFMWANPIIWLSIFWQNANITLWKGSLKRFHANALGTNTSCSCHSRAEWTLRP